MKARYTRQVASEFKRSTAFLAKIGNSHRTRDVEIIEIILIVDIYTVRPLVSFPTILPKIWTDIRASRVQDQCI